MPDVAPPSATPPAHPTLPPAAAPGAWIGALVVAYGSFVSVVNGMLLAALLPVSPLLEWTALDIERRAYDQGGVEGVVDVGNVVRATWAAVEAPLVFASLGGTLLALAVLVFGLGVVVGRERARVAARVAVALRALHEVAAAVWLGIAVLPSLRAHTESVYAALRAAAEEAGQLGRIGDPPGILTGGALPWAAEIGAALHILVLIWLFRLLGRPQVREWCELRGRPRRASPPSGNREGAPAIADAPGEDLG